MRDHSATVVMKTMGQSPIRIGMKPCQKEIHAQKGKEDGEKADYGHDGRLFTPPADGQPLVQEGRIEAPGNQRPSLLGIPAPVRSPGILSPDRARNDPNGEKGKSKGQCFVVNFVQHS